MNYTILGASGFIGSQLRTHLESNGHNVFSPTAKDPDLFTRDLGHVFYCIGLTADFRTRPFDTVEAHICVLSKILEKAHFDSLIYLSSTRIYDKTGEASENTPIIVDSSDPSDLYNLSKLMGESLCLSCNRENIRIARLANVYGTDFYSDNFLVSLIRDAIDKRKITLRTAMESAKDYISIRDVVILLLNIATLGQKKVYNVASGVNVDNLALTSHLTELTGCKVGVTLEAPRIVYPTISVSRIHDEFGFHASSLMEDLPSLVEQYRRKNNDKD